MDFPSFGNLLKQIGFRDKEPATPSFILTKNDLKNKVFKEGYTKIVGHYCVTSIWSQEGEVAFWAQEDNSGTKLFPFHKEEVDFLAKRKKFRR